MNKLIYKDDDLMIKFNILKGVYFQIKPQNKDDFITIDLTPNCIDPKNAADLAPILKLIFDRVYKYAYSQGFIKGEEVGKKEIQTKLKELLDIKD